MPDSSSPGEATSYYLGIGGEQTGPFSEEVIVESIRNESIPQEALIWKDGWSSWRPIASLPPFQQAFKSDSGESTASNLSSSSVTLAPTGSDTNTSNNAPANPTPTDTGADPPPSATVSTGAVIAEETHKPESTPPPEKEEEVIAAPTPATTTEAEQTDTAITETAAQNTNTDIVETKTSEDSPESVQSAPKELPAASESETESESVPEAESESETVEGAIATASSTYAMDDDSTGPVFQREESDLRDKTLAKNKVSVSVGVVCVLCLGIGALIYSTIKDTDPAKLKSEKVRASKKVDIRDLRLRKALAELDLKPKEMLPELQKLIEEKNDDKVAAQALDASLGYYRRNRRFLEAGDLLTFAGKPLESISYYMNERNPAPRKAVSAYEAAFKAESDPKKKANLLSKQIQLLLGPLNNRAQAILKIKIHDRDLPSFDHPYQYYLMSVEDKIINLFNRIAFFFVQTLLSYVETEFSQINFVNRPLIELKKDDGNRYRIVGSYRGDILLNRDRMTDMKLVFWMWNGQWSLVETNLTQERAKWAQQQKKKRRGQTYSREQTLTYLEQLFLSEFPNRALHESVSTRDLSSP